MNDRSLAAPTTRLRMAWVRSRVDSVAIGGAQLAARDEASERVMIEDDDIA